MAGRVGNEVEAVLEARNFVTLQAQASIFTPGLTFQASRVLGHLLSRYGDTFDGDPVSLPAPEGILLPEAPRVILQSRDGTVRLMASPARLDLFRAGEDIEKVQPLGEFLNWCESVMGHYLQGTDKRVGRLACVLTRAADAEQPAREVAGHFCRPELLKTPLNRPSDFEVHAAKQFLFDGWIEINSWFRCKSGALSARSGLGRQVVLIGQDFNTKQEEAESREFSSEDRRRFFDRAPAEFQKVLELYFPNEGA
jgi:hypothetical protein